MKPVHKAHRWGEVDIDAFDDGLTLLFPDNPGITLSRGDAEDMVEDVQVALRELMIQLEALAYDRKEREE